ncbi:MAG: TolB family protein, partial [Planctomycetota bacterium]
MGPVSRLVAVALLGVSFAGAALAADDARKLYTKRATWQETMLATRERLVRSLDKDSSSRAPSPGQWYATRPLKAPKFETKHFPLDGIDLLAKGPGGKPLWQMRPGYSDGAVHSLPLGDRSSTYLFRTVTASAPAKVTANLGSDDGLEIWLNDKKVLSRNVARGAGPDQDRAELDLKKGENRLLLKIHNIGGGYGFYFSLGKKADTPADKLVDMIAKDFPRESALMKRDLGRAGQSGWLLKSDSTALDNRMITQVLSRVGDAGKALRRKLDSLLSNGVKSGDPRWLDLYLETCRTREGIEALDRIDYTALRLAIEDLAKTFPKRYAKGAEYVAKLRDFDTRLPGLKEALGRGDDRAIREMTEFAGIARRSLIENPLIDFDKLLVVRRAEGKMGLPQNWQGNCAVSRTGYDNEIAVMSPVRPGGKVSTLHKPDGGKFVGDVDLHFDADRMIFSSIGTHGRWQIFEMKADGTGLRQVTPGEYPDVDNYDPCYLPNGKIIFGSTRCFHGVPCVGGGNTVANLCIMDSDGKNIRQITFDQDHDWSPSVKNDGRVLYTRWEYSDAAHYFTRLMFHMNPDGSGQREYYGSNSLWPNSTFYARAIPGHPSKVVGIVSGHHGVPRMGELVIFNPAEGRHEADGAVQRIPGRGKKVEPRIADGLVNGSWPKFLHPYPLSEKYFLVSAKPKPDSLWGIYLVDVFDNMLLLAEEPGYALLEPVPLRKTRKPRIIPDRVDPTRSDATVYVADIYRGQGMKGVPKGAVKKLRVYEYHYCYPRMGGHINIGIDGPWDVHRVHG